jgi:cell division protein FtsQ
MLKIKFLCAQEIARLKFLLETLIAWIRKITNFKAFYQKAKKDSLLKRYKRVNLKFNQQVVGIK